MHASMPIAVTAALLIALSGCATITRGTGEVLIVETEPPGAEVSIEPGSVKCKSPCSIELKRKKDYKVSIEKKGYESVQTDVLSQIVGAGAAGMAGNVLVGGIIGAGIDAYSGAMKGLKPNPLKIKLEPLARGSSEDKSAETPQPVAKALDTEVRESPQAAISAKSLNDCVQDSKVEREQCSGRLKLAMSKEEVLEVLGLPDGRSDDQRTLTYGDRALQFDAEDRLTAITEVNALGSQPLDHT